MSGVHDLFEVHAMRAQRANPIPMFLHVGELKSYRASDNTVDVYLPHVDDAPTGANTQSYRMPLMTMWAGSGYGDQCAPEPGVQVACMTSSPDGDDYMAVGFFYTSNQLPPGTPSLERWITDKRGSALKFTVDGKTAGDGAGGVKLVGNGYASIVAPLTELGAQGLDPTLDAVVTVRQMRTYVDAIFNAHIHGGVTTGAGLTAAPTSTITSQGSTTVRAKP